MKIKLFHAETMHEAIRAIKEEMGPDAVILSTKQVRQGSLPFRLFGRPMLEVTAATDRDTQEFAPTPRPAKPVVRQAPQPVAPTRAPAPASAFEDTLSILLRSSGRTDARARNASVEVPARPSHPVSQPTERPSQPREEFRGFDQRQTSSASDDGSLAGAGFPAPIAKACRQLMAQGLRPASAESLCQVLRRRLAPEGLPTDGEVQSLLHRLLAEPIRVSGPLLSPGDDYNVAMFVGPSGVGKTSAIVKLAARYSLDEHKSVVLITMDTCRMAAVEHLRTYANVLGVTLETAQTTADVIACLRRHRGANLVLIDTPGFGANENEAARLTSLGGLKDAYGPIETHLVLAANTRMQDLRRTVTRYDVCAPSRLLFTKLDETVEYGNLFELAYQTALPLSYWGIGQQVPADLELAHSGRLADLLLERGSVHLPSPGLSSPAGCDAIASFGSTTPQHVL